MSGSACGAGVVTMTASKGPSVCPSRGRGQPLRRVTLVLEGGDLPRRTARPALAPDAGRFALMPGTPTQRARARLFHRLRGPRCRTRPSLPCHSWTTLCAPLVPALDLQVEVRGAHREVPARGGRTPHSTVSSARRVGVAVQHASGGDTATRSASLLGDGDRVPLLLQQSRGGEAGNPGALFFFFFFFFFFFL